MPSATRCFVGAEVRGKDAIVRIGGGRLYPKMDPIQSCPSLRKGPNVDLVEVPGPKVSFKLEFLVAETIFETKIYTASAKFLVVLTVLVGGFNRCLYFVGTVLLQCRSLFFGR